MNKIIVGMGEALWDVVRPLPISLIMYHSLVLIVV